MLKKLLNPFYSILILLVPLQEQGAEKPKKIIPPITIKELTKEHIVHRQNKQQQEYVASLIERMDSFKLYEKRYWLLLLHQTPNQKKFESEVDGLHFFFSWEGKQDLRKEMLATLWAMSEPLEDYEENWHPQCRFPGRYTWLKKELNFDSKKIPEIPCPNLTFWLKSIDFNHLSLVFASHFLGAPASSFGHTFLKLHAKEFKNIDLLGHSINFAAIVPPQVGIIEYFFKGIGGGFQGGFSLLPYHEKVKEYNDFEKRDLWEYKLNLKKEEIIQMLLHTWELAHANFDYYFFKENCSYHLLSLIEIARPTLDLRSHYTGWTIPAETIKLLYKKNMIVDFTYRPSTTTIIEQRLENLDEEEKKFFYTLFSGKDPNLVFQDPSFLKKDFNKQVNILDAALFALRDKYEENRDKITGKSIIERAFYEELLKERAKLPSPKEEFKAKQREEGPHKSHSVFSLKTALGLSNAGAYLGLALRLPIHELLNNQDGYPLDSTIVFLNTDLRLYDKQKWPYLYDLTFLRLLNITPFEKFTKNLSYDIIIRVGSEFLKKDENGALYFDDNQNLKFANTFETMGGGGLTAMISKKYRFLYTFLAGSSYRYAPGRAYNRHTIAPMLSNRFLLGEGIFRSELLIEYFYYSLFFKVQSELEASLRFRFTIKKEIESLIEVSQRKNYQQYSLNFIWHL